MCTPSSNEIDAAQEDGTFSEESETSLAFDNDVGINDGWKCTRFDGDDDLDLFILNLMPQSICENIGDGTFVNRSTGGSRQDSYNYHSVVWGDQTTMVI